MTKTTSSHAAVLTGLAIVSALMLGTFIAPARADDHGDRHRDGDHEGYRQGWGGGGYYRPPPVVYGYPGYYPPPVVYGPGVGIYLPGIGINIR